MKTLLFLVCLFSASFAEHQSYEGYTVYRVVPQTPEDSAILEQIYNSDKFDFWSKSKMVQRPVDIMVSPDLKETFASLMNTHELDYKVLIEDVETVNEAERQRQARAPKVEKGRINFEQYHRYDAILEYLDTLAAAHPDTVTVKEYGRSFEDRPLRLLRVGCQPSTDKPTIFIEGGIHAREWIAPAVVLYIAHQLIENPENIALVENVCWILVTVTNPDGYEYTYNYDRMWRKTRSTGIICNGADGNRNFDVEWGGPGTSTSECSNTFRGRFPFSEPETAALRDAALEELPIDLYLSLHSYGQYILFPWGHTTDLPDNADELLEVSTKAAEAIEAVYNTEYAAGNTVELLYFASGGGHDWFKAKADVPLSFTIELPGGANGGGFDLPADRIQPVVAETWAGVVSLYESVVGTYKK